MKANLKWVTGLVLLDVLWRESKRARQLAHDFERWQLNNSVYWHVGTRGPLGFVGAFSAADAEKVLIWLKGQKGVKIG